MENNINIIGHTKQNSIYSLNWYCDRYSNNVKMRKKDEITLNNGKKIIATSVNDNNIGRRGFIEISADRFEAYVLQKENERLKEEKAKLLRKINNVKEYCEKESNELSKYEGRYVCEDVLTKLKEGSVE